jgi:ribosomal protein L37AE/L43A
MMETFFSWVLAAAFAYAAFSDNRKEQPEIVEEPKEREAELFCKNCRKTQHHYEIEPYLFECKHCGKETDLRR